MSTMEFLKQLKKDVNNILIDIVLGKIKNETERTLVFHSSLEELVTSFLERMKVDFIKYYPRDDEVGFTIKG